MKKVLSILMSILIIALSLTLIAGAAGCDCKDHTDAASGCHCCINCDNFDVHYATSCVKKVDGNGNVVIDGSTRCCIECTGIIPCDCGCDCCAPDADNDSSAPDPILTPDQQEQVVSGFQKVLARIREFFDNFFNTIFEFLRFDEIMGN